MGITLNDIKNSKYLTKDDAGELGLNLTIAGVRMEELENDGKKEQKACVHWLETDPRTAQIVKPMVCGVTNFQLISMVAGQSPETADTDGWTGLRVNVYNDPTIAFGTRVTGGLRVRRPTDVPTPGEVYREGLQQPQNAGAGSQPPVQVQGGPGAMPQQAGDIAGSFEEAMNESGYK